MLNIVNRDGISVLVNFLKMQADNLNKEQQLAKREFMINYRYRGSTIVIFKFEMPIRGRMVTGMEFFMDLNCIDYDKFMAAFPRYMDIMNDPTGPGMSWDIMTNVGDDAIPYLDIQFMGFIYDEKDPLKVFMNCRKVIDLIIEDGYHQVPALTSRYFEFSNTSVNQLDTLNDYALDITMYADEMLTGSECSNQVVRQMFIDDIRRTIFGTQDTHDTDVSIEYVPKTKKTSPVMGDQHHFRITTSSRDVVNKYIIPALHRAYHG